MSHIAYYLGGPADLRKEVVAGSHALPTRYIEYLPPMTYPDLSVGSSPKEVTLRVTATRYDLLTTYHGQNGMVAIYFSAQ